MDAVPDQDLAVPRGLARTIAYARDATGACPAREFVLALPMPARQRLWNQFAQMAAHGRIATRHFRKESGCIWSFKLTSGERVPAFSLGRVWYLTHGFKKQRDRWPRTELERAERIRQEHLRWMGRPPGSA